MTNYFNRYFETALQLIGNYDGSQPLSIYLKNYFSQHKKHGSKDRKWIAHFCYCYYRLGFALQELSGEERLRIAIFLCSDKKDKWLSFYDENWQAGYNENLNKRTQFIQSFYPFHIETIFFSNDWLSHDIDSSSFNISHLVQPDLFIRIRPGKEKIVNDKLRQNNIVFEQVNEHCLAVNNSTKTDSIINLNEEVVIQDYSSQQIASFFSLLTLSKQPSVWDCCAASGGKSILVYDCLPTVKITVSDIRESIIHNLNQRFRQAGIQHYQSFIADISSPQFLSGQQYDLVICDAPCSGSGTWSRTPEQLVFFTEKKLHHYTELQKKITTNAVKSVKQNGYFLYITCSVFVQENEQMITHILEAGKLQLVKAEVIKGYNRKADTMFAALFISQ